MANFQYQENASSGTSGSTGSSTSKSGTANWYDPYARDLFMRGREASMDPWQVYGGQRVADFVGDQSNAFGNLRGQMGSWQPNMQQANQATGSALGMMQGLQQSPYTQGALNAYSQSIQQSQWDPNTQQQFMNPYVKNVTDEIARLGNQNFRENTMNTLNNNFTESGQFGSARQMAMAADAAARNQREISGAQGNALFQAQNQAANQYGDWANRGINAQQVAAQGNMGINQFLQGLGTATGALGNQFAQLGQTGQQMGLTDVNALLGIGNQQQALDQKRLDAQQQQFQEGQLAPWQPLQNLSNIYKNTPIPQSSVSGSYNTSGSTSQSSGWGTNFRRGGLVQFAEGGEFDERSDEVPSGLLQYLISQNQQVPSHPSELYESIENNPSFAPTPEGSFLGNAGKAMLRAAAQGPGNYGQLIGRTGAAYFDDQENRDKTNFAKALKQSELLGEVSKLNHLKTNPYSLSKFGKIAVEMGFTPGTPEFTKKVEELMSTGKSLGELSVPGKIARDEGLVPGTPEYGARVKELHAFEQDIKKRGVEVREETADTYAGNLGARNKEQVARFGDIPGSSSVSPSGLPTAKMVGTPEQIKADIEKIADPVERKAALDAYNRTSEEKLSRHPGVLKFVNQGLPIKSALERFETEGKEYDKMRESLTKDAEPLSTGDFDRALQLNEQIRKSSGPGTGAWYNIPYSSDIMSSMPGKYGEAVGELRALGTRLIPSLTKGLTPVSNTDMQAMSKAGFGPEFGYATNKANIEKARSSLALFKEYETFNNAAQEMGLSPSQAKVEWNNFIRKNPLFDLKKADKTGVLQYNKDPASRAELLDSYISLTQKKFFQGLRSGKFSPNKEEKKESDVIVITPEMLGE